jgi:hypothetical protein
MSETTMLTVLASDWTQAATAEQDFSMQNPVSNNMLYVVNAATKPEIDPAEEGYVSGKRVPPYGFYGRMDTANQALLQGIVWLRADQDISIPIDK